MYFVVLFAFTFLSCLYFYLGSENDCPDIFEDDQLYIVLELRHGGTDLESFVFSSADQGLAAFKQVRFSHCSHVLSFQLQHLHWFLSLGE